jgi:hypothetical protein
VADPRVRILTAGEVAAEILRTHPRKEDS